MALTAVCELLINRLALGHGLTGWAWLSLFFHYLLGTMALACVVGIVVPHMRARGFAKVPWAVVLIVALATAATMVVSARNGATPWLGRWHVVVAATMALLIFTQASWEGRVGLGVRLLAVPCLVAAAAVWLSGADAALSNLTPTIVAGKRLAVRAAAVVGVVLPYFLAPPPFGRAARAWGPALIASVGTLGLAYIVRHKMVWSFRAAENVFGLSLSRGPIDPLLWLYLLAVGSLLWTSASLWLARGATDLRRARLRLAVGLALLPLGGLLRATPAYQLAWLAAAVLVVEASRELRILSLGSPSTSAEAS